MQLAARLFQERQFAEGSAYVNRGLGMVWRAEGHYEESERVLRAALAHFSEHGEAAEAARTQLEIARTTRIGIGPGAVLLGNVGTYRKIDFTAVGTTTNLAARLQSEAEPLVPCISRATFEEVGQRFTFKAGSPRRITPKGLTIQEVWDVAGRATR